MKFLCLSCDAVMAFAERQIPGDGTLAAVFRCPACGREIAMLANPYETQLVSSLGVRIGPADSAETSAGDLSKCPFGEMVQQMRADGSTATVSWTPGARLRLDRVPEFARPMARAGIEKFAVDNGFTNVDEEVLDKAKDFFGM